MKYIINRFFSNYLVSNRFHTSEETITPLKIPQTIFDLLKIIFFSVNTTYLSKLQFYHSVIENIFFSKEIRHYFQELFCQFQRHYRLFSKLAILYRLKKAKIVVDHDLLFAKLDPKQSHVFQLYQNGSIYLFHIRDLVKLIYLNITHAPYFFFDPLPVKNPYNNIILRKSTLYNIFFFLKFNTFIQSDFLDLFFRANFDTKELFANHRLLLREFAISNYLRCETINLRGDIEDMLQYYNLKSECKFQIHVHSNFPTQLLIKIMKPYLHLFLLFLHSYAEIEVIRAESELLEKLKTLSIINPTFGQMKPDQSYDSRCPRFHLKETVSIFLHSHVPIRGIRL